MSALKHLPRLIAAGRQQARTLSSVVAVRGGAAEEGAAYGGAALAAAAALAACVACVSEPSHMSYGPIAGLDDVMKVESKLKALEERVADVEADADFPARKTNSAFVFVKPAAVTPQTCQLVEKTFADMGITVTGSGKLDARTIDKEQLIDTHYGAIASKAVKLKPSELTVKAKAQEEFKQAFGLSWEEALAKGMVYNATDGCAKMGCKPTEMEAKYWSKLVKGKNLLKFGGGFYCGKLAEDVFVINGFYMSMRSVFTTPPATLQWYTVEWPAAKLSWEDFRGKVLGATDPKTAAEGSVRRVIYDTWKTLKLKAEPNVGDNGVHASASPFEALAERCNWLKASVDSDPYGAACIAAGVPAEFLKAGFEDPLVEVDGKPTSLFDYVEDKDSKEVIKLLAGVAK